MTVELCRIDDRLIHGQVVTTWLNVKQIEQVIIINKAVAEDKIQSSVLKMSIPSTVKLRIFSPEKFLKIIGKNPITRRTLLLFASPFDVEKLIDGGFEIKDVNVGGIRGNDKRKQFTKAVFLTPEEQGCFERMIARGVNVQVQMVPSDNAVAMQEVLSK